MQTWAGHSLTIAVTLDLPESLIEHAKRFGGATQQKFDEVLAEVLETIVPMLEDANGYDPE